MTDRPTRLVRARDLIRGATVLEDCGGPAPYCPFEADQHKSATGDGVIHVVHELTLIDVEAHGDDMSAIAVTESGGQAPLWKAAHLIVRVYADTMPLTAPEETTADA